MKNKFWPVPSAERIVPRSKSRRGFGSNRKGGRFHSGTDIMAKYESNVIAIESGIVKNIFTFTYPELDKYYKYEITYAIVIQHEDGNFALYGEVQKPSLKIGQKIREGQAIAKVGRIFSNKPHHTMLHFEYHSKLPKSTTKWYIGKRPKGLLSSTKYLTSVVDYS